MVRFDRLGHRDHGGEIDQVGGAGIFQNHLQNRIGDEDGAQTDAHRADHEGEADRDAQNVRHGAAKTVGQPGRQAA